MNNQSYLTFSLHNLIFGLEISLVKEILPLPELLIIPETPGDIIGVLSIRDRLIPVMHLDRRLGKPIQECRSSDQIIVMQWNDIKMGVIVNEVLNVVELDFRSLKPEPDYGRENYINTAFISYVATNDQQSIIILNSEALIRQPDAIIECLNSAEISDLTTRNEQQNNLISDFFDLYCPNATVKERAIFRQRARELQQTLKTEQTQGTMALAVFSLGEEYFGCDLTLVREFIDIDRITPIPCCPNHIVGNINLRGEIITLVDIRSTLNFAKTDKPAEQAIVVQINDINAGIIVDEIFDVVSIDSQQLTSNLTGVAAEIKPFFQGMTMYEKQEEKHILSALDLAKIFTEM
jgi:purine-binding chemotaxis protein CheW